MWNSFEDEDVYKIIELFDPKVKKFCVEISKFLTRKGILEIDFDNGVFLFYLAKGENINLGYNNFIIYYTPRKGFSIEIEPKFRNKYNEIYNSYNYNEFINLLFKVDK
jgi:hypothetical protein